ncbi:hypothetical protein NX059_010404 [Plenodomus lindquistii]|nr:hypothetical protein NX059_010404 [Plenodomus lindquistii]
MGRGAYNFCGRDSMPTGPVLEDERSTLEKSEAILQQAFENLTSQQQEEFTVFAKSRGSGKVKWKPFSEPTIEEPVNSYWIEQQAEFPSQAPAPSSRRKARAKATTPASHSLDDAKPVAPALTSSPVTVLPPITTSENSNLPNESNSRRRNNNGKPNKMTPPAGIPPHVSIPPHLRRRNAAAAAKAGTTEESGNTIDASKAPNVSALGLANVTPSPSTSGNSKNNGGAHHHSSPLGAKHLATSPPSPPSTNQDSDKFGGSSGPAPSKCQQQAKTVERTPSVPAHFPATGRAQNAATPAWDTVEYPPTAPRNSRNAINPSWDTVQYPPVVTSNSQNANWPQNRTWNAAQGSSKPTGQGWNGQWNRVPRQPWKKTVWPKARDMKPLPSEDESDGGVEYKSDSGGDEFYDVRKLMDYNGDWLPPPESWAWRKGFSDRHFSDTVDKWIVLDLGLLRPMKLEEPAFSGRHSQSGSVATYIGNKTIPAIHEHLELVPRTWVEPRIEDKTLREYWKDMPKKNPEPMPDCDIMADPPWWDRYVDETSCYITSLAVPEARVNMHDEENPVAPYKLACVEDKLAAIEKRKKEALEKQMAWRNRPMPERMSLPAPVESTGIQPTANIYLRPVQPADVRGIAEIYNYYVEHSFFANEFDGRTEDHIGRRIDVVTRAGLPYLVAVAKGNHPRNHPGYIAEKIVGWISLDDYVDQSSMFRYTFEMELFVHPGFVQQRIAMCLLDKLLELADPSYLAKGGYDYVNDSDYLKTGPGRVIKTILLNVHHESGKDVEWQSKFLNSFGLKRCGRMPGVGYKHGQIVDVSIFSCKTGEVVHAAGLPANALVPGGGRLGKSRVLCFELTN